MFKSGNHICGNSDSIIIQSTMDRLSASVDVSVENRKIHVGSVPDDVKWKIWEQLYRSRELEIKTQWQRSAFLATFIVLLLTGTGVFYFYFVLKKSCGMFFNYCLTSLFLGCLLIISGILWLAMTKGSKYWTQVYEKKIELLEKELPIKRQYTYVEEFNVDNAAVDHELLVETSCVNPWKPDHESPSSVNCSIGIIILLIGLLMLFLPAIVYWSRVDAATCMTYCCNVIFISCLVLLMMIVTSWFVYCMVRHKCGGANK